MKLTGERRALSAAVLALYGLLYLMLTLAQAMPGWGAAYGAMAGVYGLGFFALVAGYFWARWYAMGVGLSGVITAAVGMWQIGPEPILVFVGGTHLLCAAALWGGGMATLFEGRTEWRKRFHMDDHAVERLGKSVIRAGVSLPYVLLYALAPKSGGAAAFLALGLAGAGLAATIRMRTWGVLATGAAGLVLLADAVSQPGCVTSAPAPLLVGVGLLAATAPFVPSILRALGLLSAAADRAAPTR